MFRSFIRRLMWFHDASPASGEQQSGPRQMNRWRRSLPMPNAAAMTSAGRLSGLAIGGMIAGMKGLGTGQTRSVLRRGGGGLGRTLGAGLLASRINPPDPPAAGLPAAPAVADEVLAGLRLDTSSLAA